MSVPILSIRELVVRYGEFAAVRGVDLVVEETAQGGGLVALVGPSGCGKTSLLRAVAGFETPVSGSISILGQTVCGPDVWVPPERRQVGMVFQEGALFPHLTVAKNVGYGLPKSVGKAEAVARQLDLVGLASLGDRYPDELSGGQRQRVALARALAPEPRLVLLDEPFASLDEVLRLKMRGEVRTILQTQGATGLLVTHDQEEALSMADTVVVMQEGEILQVGSPQKIYQEPATLPVADFFGSGHLLRCSSQGGALRSELGSVVCQGGEQEGLLHVRPEDLALEACEVQVAQNGESSDLNSGQGLGTIVSREFLGHDVLDTVHMNSGLKLEARVLAPDVLPIGTLVQVTLRPRAYQVFPDGSDESN